jgi:hypothetical protein
MKKLTQKQAEANAKKEINRLLSVIKENALKKVTKALKSGCIEEESEFLEANCLLALTVLEDEFCDYKVRSGSYRKEAEHIQLFI